MGINQCRGENDDIENDEYNFRSKGFEWQEGRDCLASGK
jgi:hypothetical protein